MQLHDRVVLELNVNTMLELPGILIGKGRLEDARGAKIKNHASTNARWEDKKKKKTQLLF